MKTLTVLILFFSFGSEILATLDLRVLVTEFGLKNSALGDLDESCKQDLSLLIEKSKEQENWALKGEIQLNSSKLLKNKI